MGSHQQSGIAACFSLDEYDAGSIKKHEKTRPDKEDDRTKHMLAIGAQTGPVFLTYAASPAVDDVVERSTEREALFDFEAADGVRHVIWRVADEEATALVRGFTAIANLYIADGHHRAASAARTRRALTGRGPGEQDRVLAVAFADDQMQILPYNRVIRDLHGLSPGDFLEALRSRVTLSETGSGIPPGRGHVDLYLQGRWYAFQFGPASAGRDAAGALDVSRLQDAVLSPILGIHDVRTDKRIDFVGGNRGVTELERLVDSGQFAAAFSLHPVTIGDLMRIADAGGIMPPKSTWFEPKLRDGLLSHLI
jgi:uncharacterized protein (DUF1015 family)